MKYLKMLLDEEPHEESSDRLTLETPEQATESAAARIARLDAERIARDRAARRGYDYATKRQPAHDDFDRCEVCGEPAGLIVPPQAAVHGARRFCSIECYTNAREAITH